MKINVLVLILGLFYFPISAQALTITEVVDAVRAAHPRIEEARQSAKSAHSRIHAESWLPDPEVGVMFEEVPTGLSLGDADMTTYSVSQSVPFPTKIVTKAQSLSHDHKAKTAIATETERRVVFEAKKTFYELVAARNALSDKTSVVHYYQQAISGLSKAYEMRGVQVDAESMSQGAEGADNSNIFDDILMLKMKKAEAEAEIHDLRHAEKALSSKLNLMMGREAETKIGRLSSPGVKTLKLSVKELEEKLLKQNADLTALLWLVKKSEKDVSLARQNLLPTLTPEVEYNQRQNNVNAYSLGLKLSVPLWFTRNSSEIKSAKAEAFRMRAEYDSAKLDVRAELHNLVNYAKWHYQILGKYRSEILPLARSLVNRALASQTANQTVLSITSQKLIGYHQASTMYWEMWKDYQIEYAMLEELVGEDL